jgi:hypothetical protein
VNQLQWLQVNSYEVSVECNRHRGYCKSAADEIEESPETFSDLSAGQKAELIARDQICIVQLYPDTSVGFLFFIGPDAAACVEQAYLWLCKERGVTPDPEGGPSAQ